MHCTDTAGNAAMVTEESRKDGRLDERANGGKEEAESADCWASKWAVYVQRGQRKREGKRCRWLTVEADGRHGGGTLKETYSMGEKAAGGTKKHRLQREAACGIVEGTRGGEVCRYAGK